MTARDERRRARSLLVLSVMLDVGARRRRSEGTRRVGVSEGPSLLCAGVHGEGGGL